MQQQWEATANNKKKSLYQVLVQSIVKLCAVQTRLLLFFLESTCAAALTIPKKIVEIQFDLRATFFLVALFYSLFLLQLSLTSNTRLVVWPSEFPGTRKCKRNTTKRWRRKINVIGALYLAVLYVLFFEFRHVSILHFCS